MSTAIHPYLRLAGLEPLVVRPETNFINVGERTNVTGSKKFARLIREGLYEEALSVARHQVENGAQVLDVNMDDALLDGVEAMATFLNMLQAEPRYCPHSHYDRQLKIRDHRSGAEVCTGQMHCQLHQYEGGRGQIY